MTYTYLGPYRWVSDPAEPHWARPAACVGAVDLRGATAQAQADGAPGIGVFVTRRKLGADYTLLGNDEPDEIKTTGKLRDAWESVAGFRPQGDTVDRMLLDHLTRGSDPDGEAGPRTLMPRRQGRAHWFNLHLGRKVRAIPFAWGEDAEATERVRAMLRREFRRLMRDAGDGRLKDRRHHRRVLDFWCEQYGLKGARDWEDLVPADLRADVPGRLPHETIIDDTFNRADAVGLGTASGGFGWSNQGAGSWNTASNTAEAQGSDSVVRADSDLSSADHYAQFQVTQEKLTNPAGSAGPLTRYSASAQTYYMGRRRADTNNAEIFKRVAGTLTSLAAAAWSATAPYTVQTESVGSDHTVYGEAVSRVTVTDTSIAGGTRTGMRDNASGGTKTRVDNYEASDVSADGISFITLSWNARGVAQGVFAKGR